MTNLVLIGSLWLASRIASRAIGSGTPDISNITRPGLTTATQWSGAPLPDPIRTSAGFLVTGLSGKTRIQTRPPRLMWWVMARRAASIWRLVSQQTSSALVSTSGSAPDAELSVSGAASADAFGAVASVADASAAASGVAAGSG